MPVKQGSGIRKSGRVFGQGQKAAKMVRPGLRAHVSTEDQQVKLKSLRCVSVSAHESFANK